MQQPRIHPNWFRPMIHPGWLRPGAWPHVPARTAASGPSVPVIPAGTVAFNRAASPPYPSRIIFRSALPCLRMELCWLPSSGHIEIPLPEPRHRRPRFSC